MTFKPKFDSYFLTFIILAILLIGGATMFPLFLKEAKDELVAVILICTSLFLIITTIILWSILSIRYVFKNSYLFVKGGPFRSRIPYDTVTRVTPTKDIYTGYRLSTSRDGLEIFYEKALLGSVKISPEEKAQFIAELRERCPNAVFNI